MKRAIIACLLLCACGGLFIETGSEVFGRRFRAITHHYERLLYPEHLKGNKRRICELENERLAEIVKLCDEAEAAGVASVDTYRKQKPADCEKLSDVFPATLPDDNAPPAGDPAHDLDD